MARMGKNYTDRAMLPRSIEITEPAHEFVSEPKVGGPVILLPLRNSCTGTLSNPVSYTYTGEVRLTMKHSRRVGSKDQTPFRLSEGQ